jgi:hypothetical protein
MQEQRESLQEIEQALEFQRRRGNVLKALWLLYAAMLVVGSRMPRMAVRQFGPDVFFAVFVFTIAILAAIGLILLARSVRHMLASRRLRREADHLRRLLTGEKPRPLWMRALLWIVKRIRGRGRNHDNNT